MDAVKALGFYAGVLHAELKYTSRTGPQLIEVGMVPGLLQVLHSMLNCTKPSTGCLESAIRQLDLGSAASMSVIVTSKSLLALRMHTDASSRFRSRKH